MPTRSEPDICVFAPSPILTITIERGPEDVPDVHLHPGGQGFWVARMAAQLGALTEEFRGLSHQVALEVERLGVVTKRVDEITATVAKIVGVLAGLSKIGEIAVIGSGLRRGLGVFVSRLKSRAS